MSSSKKLINRVVIRLLRVGETQKEKNDDLIRITLEDANLRINYDYGDSNLRSTLLLTRTGLADYVDTLVKLVRSDNDPFASVQFEFPGYPTFLFTPARLQNPEVASQLRAAARDVHESWLANIPDDASSTTYSSTDSEEEYADMPPLIRVSSAWPRDL